MICSVVYGKFRCEILTPLGHLGALKAVKVESPMDRVGRFYVNIVAVGSLHAFEFQIFRLLNASLECTQMHAKIQHSLFEGRMAEAVHWRVDHNGFQR